MLFRITYRPIVCVSCKTDIQLFVKERNKMEKILKLEAERKDTVFRSNYNAEQRRGFPPFTFSAWGEHKTEIDQIVSEIESGNIALDQGHDRVKHLMEKYYGCPYPID